MRSFRIFVCWANLRSSQRSNASQEKRDMAEYETAGIRRKGVRARSYTYIARLSTHTTILAHYVPRGGYEGSPAMLAHPWRRLVPERGEGCVQCWSSAQVGRAARPEDARRDDSGRSVRTELQYIVCISDPQSRLCPRHLARTSHFAVTFTIYPSPPPPPSSAPWVVFCSRWVWFMTGICAVTEPASLRLSSSETAGTYAVATPS